MKGPLALQFGTVISAFHVGKRVLGVFIGIHVSLHDQYYNAVHKFDIALSVFGRVKMSLSLAMRVLVVNVFMFYTFLVPKLTFFMPRVLLQEIERKVLRFLTPITWAKLGMFSAVGALYGTTLPSRLQTFQCCQYAVHSRSLEGHSSWYDFCIGTMVTTTHISSQNPAISWTGFVRHCQPPGVTIYRSDGGKTGSRHHC